MKDIIQIHIKDHLGELISLELPNEAGYSLMEILRAAEIPLLGMCGGIALCASCHIYILKPHTLPEPNDEEIHLLDTLPNSKPNSRLSCQLPFNELLHNLEIELAITDPL